MFKTILYYKHPISGLIESRPNRGRSRPHSLPSMSLSPPFSRPPSLAPPSQPVVTPLVQAYAPLSGPPPPLVPACLLPRSPIFKWSNYYLLFLMNFVRRTAPAASVAIDYGTILMEEDDIQLFCRRQPAVAAGSCLIIFRKLVFIRTNLISV